MTVTTSDSVELEQLFARLAFNLDYGNSEAYAADFAEDGTFEVVGIPEDAEHYGKHAGRDGLVGFVETLFRVTQGQVRHWHQTRVVQVLSDTELLVTSYFTVFRVGEAPLAGVILTGIYRDRMIRKGGRWLVQERFVQGDPQPEHPSPSTDILVVRHDARVR